MCKKFEIKKAFEENVSFIVVRKYQLVPPIQLTIVFFHVYNGLWSIIVCIYISNFEFRICIHNNKSLFVIYYAEAIFSSTTYITKPNT